MKNILLFLLFFSISAQAQQDTSLVDIKKYTIDSKVLGTERSYWVSLPLHYDSSLRYPVMYVLDASSRFSLTNTLEKELSSNGKIPQHIVVGILHPNRRLDMSFSTTKVNYAGESDTTSFLSASSGNGFKFFTFIEEELMKAVEQRFSTSGFNILIGHSLGGYFCSYVLPIQNSFQSLQIYDPSLWYSEGEAIAQIENKLSQKTHCTIFLSSSSNFENEFAYHHKKIEELNQTFSRFPNIRCTYKNYENEQHNSMYMPSFLDGMAMLYQGYELRKGGLETEISLSRIEEHYQQFSKAMHFEFKPPIEIYREAGTLNFHQKKYQNCIDVLEVYLEKKAADAYALELIGDAYSIVGKKRLGQQSYKKAYALSPENIRLKEKIQQ